MKKKIFIIIAAFLSTVSLFAETVSQKQAQQMAQLFFNESAGRVMAPPKLVYNGKKLTTARLFSPFYVYNNSLGGFVIISAENKAFPILGFSLTDNFDPGSLGETELALLKSYAREIELIRYDSQDVEGTQWCWQNYDSYVNKILTSTYIATDPIFSPSVAGILIEEAVESDNCVYSDLYTPEQWDTMILDELDLKQSVAIGFISDETIFPAVVYGIKGDYFRIEMDRRNNWLMRLNATEVIPANMVSLVVNPLELPLIFDEEASFESHDKFLAEVVETENNRRERASIDKVGESGKPLVKANGGGHFTVMMPENIRMARIYNLSGALIRQLTFKDSSEINIDISAEPSGFYMVTLQSESDKPYGIKIYR